MPHLVCDKPDPKEDVKYYTIAGLPGNPEVPYDPAINEYGLYYDISGIPDGDYSIQASACNSLYCSLPSPLLFTKITPSILTGFIIIKE